MGKRKKDNNPLPTEKNAVFCSFDSGGKEKCYSNSFKLFHAVNMLDDKDDILFMKCNRCGNMVAIRATLKKRK